MNLIKKTVILNGESAEGYLSVIRVGDDVGAKIVGDGFRKGMQAGIKIGSSDPTFFFLEGEKTEISLQDVSFSQNDSLGCLIMENGKTVAKGGITVKIKEMKEYFSSITETTVRSEEISQEIPDKMEDSEQANENSLPETQKPSETSEEINVADIEQIKDAVSAEKKDFYSGIRERYEELFVVYPTEKKLSALIPDSEWVKINYDGEDYYVVGKLSENGKTVLLGYGVPGKKNVTPPRIADEMASWLTVPDMRPYDGYWLIFQDAATGKVTKGD